MFCLKFNIGDVISMRELQKRKLQTLTAQQSNSKSTIARQFARGAFYTPARGLTPSWGVCRRLSALAYRVCCRSREGYICSHGHLQAWTHAVLSRTHTTHATKKYCRFTSRTSGQGRLYAIDSWYLLAFKSTVTRRSGGVKNPGATDHESETRTAVSL